VSHNAWGVSYTPPTVLSNKQQISPQQANMRSPAPFTIQPGRSASQLAIIQQLFKAYASSLNLDLSFQDFSTELNNLPGKYSPPSGELLLALNSESEPIGCVGLRPLKPEEGSCEMKRLYILPEGRGMGIGKALVQAAIDTARALGYGEIKLDTLPSMVEAITLYRKAGFVETEAYYDTPIGGTVFMVRRLERADTLGAVNTALSQELKASGGPFLNARGEVLE
jgi:ribosomal protein S18 acetylase RimI-like enzyme